MPITIPDPQINSDGYGKAIAEAKGKAEVGLAAAISALKQNDWLQSANDAREAMRYLDLLAGEYGKLY